MHTNSTFLIVCIAVVVLLTNCKGSTKDNDTIARPAGIAMDASLVNIGTAEEPIWRWYEYIGALKYKGKVYSHIHGFRACNADQPNFIDTTYYENMDLRRKNRQFDFTGYKVLEDYTDIVIMNGKDSITLFPVLEDSSMFVGRKNDTLLVAVPSISFKEGGYMLDDYIDCKLKMDENRSFQLLLFGGKRVSYVLKGDLPEWPQLISFIDKENGNLYFIDTTYHLELMNKADLVMLNRQY